VRAAAGAGSSGTDDCGLGNVETAAGVHANAGGGELVPAAKLRERDAETIGDGDQGVSATGGVVDGV
jgi:hypothetical protein